MLYNFIGYLKEKWHEHFMTIEMREHHYCIKLKKIIKNLEQRSLGHDPLMEELIAIIQKEVDRLELKYENSPISMSEVKIPADFGVEAVLQRMLFELHGEARSREMNGQYFCIYMPQYAIDYLRREIVQKYHIDPRQVNEYEGMKIHAGYEDKIVIVHRDYPVYKKSWMIKVFNIAGNAPD